jgi:hypothetical protein
MSIDELDDRALADDKDALLALLLADEGFAGAGADGTPIVPGVAPNPAPLSFAQQRLWFLAQLAPDSPAYNLTTALRAAGPLDSEALEWGLREVVRRHAILRTTFPRQGDHPVQFVHPASSLALDVTELADRPAADREAEVQRLAAEEAGRLFDLERGPLLAVRLLRLGPAEHVLIVAAHHIILDGWSIGVFLRELAALYRAFRSGAPAPLAEPILQYADYAVWQRQWLHDAAYGRQLAYWTRQLADLPALRLPTDRRRAAGGLFRGDYLPVRLGPALSLRLDALSREAGTTPFLTLLSAFQVLLARYSGQDDFPVGVPVANRNRRELEGLIGFFVNTLVLRADLSGDPTFRELLDRAGRGAAAAFEHQDVPFEHVVEVLHPRREDGQTPLFQVLFVLQNIPTARQQFPGLTLTRFEMQRRTAKFDLTLALEEGDDGLDGILEYDGDLFDRDTVAGMVAHFRNLLAGIVADPHRRVSEYPLLGSEERRRALVAWNDTARPYPRGSCIHRLFEEQAARTPDAMAVAWGPRRLTYAELNRRANQLARHLRGRGVGAESPVGVALPRSPEAVVALLGILKAGGAYVPLDTAHPPSASA